MRNIIDEITKAQDELDRKVKPFDLAKMLGVKPEELEAVKSALSSALDSLKTFADESVAISQQAVEQKQAEIDAKSAELDRELALNKQGFASNVEGKKAELAALKAERNKAIEEQRKAQRLQQAIDSAAQVSSLITAAANIFQVTAPLNAVPGLGTAIAISLIALMTASFVASKAKAASISQKREGGLLAGPSHEQGGIRGTGRFNNIEVEGDEYIVNKKSTRKHRELVEAINQDDFTKVSRQSIQKVLRQTNIGVDPTVAERISEKSVQVMVMHSEGNTTLLREINSKLDKLGNLDRIARHTSHIQEEQVTQTKKGLLFTSKRGSRLIKDKED